MWPKQRTVGEQVQAGCDIAIPGCETATERTNEVALPPAEEGTEQQQLGLQHLQNEKDHHHLGNSNPGANISGNITSWRAAAQL